ncbi:MAG: M67 family metallopeptidase [Ilumatobacteraceae bacterium]|nr:M67 family metallopeptidase [Ilumatobacteraceae bacterium]
MLRVTSEVVDALVAHALGEYPLEMCGLLAGGSADDAVRFYPCRNAAESARIYTIDPKDHLRAELDAEDHDHEINGVVHSHTHSEPFPSPTDVDAAVDPAWHYVIVGLKRGLPEVRSYRIIDGEIVPEAVDVVEADIAAG